ncbi:hypothetical protein ANTHOS_154 [Bacillus phage Anthos]|uniref:Uncharacterized protein n=1 Tax=Bacillus phage Anthos TaxID=2796502 RepID=A0A7U3T8S2_9CAUD|nr:hypothetical protein ANTHOS_154 [Bacillus phage Anthos]
MIKFFTQLFCQHDYEGEYETIASVRDGNDNLVITTTRYKCKKCEDVIHKEKIDRVEKEWYKQKEEE